MNIVVMKCRMPRAATGWIENSRPMMTNSVSLVARTAGP